MWIMLVTHMRVLETHPYLLREDVILKKKKIPNEIKDSKSNLISDTMLAIQPGLQGK